MIETWSKMVEVDGVKTGHILDIFKGRAKRVYLWTGVGYEKKKEKNQGWFRVWDLSTRGMKLSRKYTYGRSKRSFFTISGNFDFLEELSHQLKENLVGKGNNLTRESNVQKKWGPFPTEQPARDE